MVAVSLKKFFFQAEDGIRDSSVMEFRRVLFRSHLTELERKLELLRNEEYEKLEKEYLKEIQDIQTSLED